MNSILEKYRTLLICLVLAFTTRLVFWQLCDYKFVGYDDLEYVIDNPQVAAGLTWDGLAWAFTTRYFSYWHPLTWLSHMLDSELFGMDSRWHHLTSVLLHIVNTLLLFAVFKRMTGAVWQSAFVAAAFGLHPLHVESVAWISERKDVLAHFFWTLTILAYLRYVRKPRPAPYLLTLLVFALALMAKPTVVTLPFVLLLLDYWPLNRLPLDRPVGNTDKSAPGPVAGRTPRRTFGRLLLEKAPFFVLTAIVSFVTFVTQQRSGALKGAAAVGIAARFSNTFISYLTYIRKMVWPADLAVFYPHPRNAIPLWWVAAAAFVLLAISLCVLRLAKSHRYLFIGWFWYLGTLVPTIGLVQAGDQALADRYTYIPLTGLFIIIAWGLNDILAKWKYRKTALALAAAVVLPALSICTYFQLRHWRDSTTLFERAVAVTKDNYLAHYNLALALIYAEGRAGEAIEHLHEVRRIRPETVDPVIMLVWLMATHKDAEYYNPQQAVRLAEQTCARVGYGNPRLLDALAAAYAAADRFSDAVAAAERACLLAQSSGQDKMAGRINDRLMLYKAGKPHIESIAKFPKTDIDPDR
ncbi:MAG: glycosyltransferase family 39 protein [Planctomycetota bacterium]|jgi:hypothetical protein